MPVSRNGNIINFVGEFGQADLHKPLACIHQAVNDAGYRDIILDFSECTAAFPPPMLALCVQIMRLRDEKVDTKLVLPRLEKLAKLFRNANWAHFLEPGKFEQSTFRGYTQIRQRNLSLQMIKIVQSIELSMQFSVLFKTLTVVTSLRLNGLSVRLQIT